MKDSYMRLTPEQQQEIAELASTSGWRLVSRESLPSIFPASFRNKLDSAVLIVSGTVQGTTTLVCNAARLDFPARAVDQEPFGVVVHGSGVSPTGIFLHHGSWPGRTTFPPAAFWEHVEASGVGNYLFSHPPFGVTGGPIDTLPSGHRQAFDAVVFRLNERGAKRDGDT